MMANGHLNFFKHGRLYWTLLVFGCLLFFSSQSFAKNCTSLFQKGKFAKAGDCFLKQASRLGSRKLSAQKRAKKGFLLRNGATSFSRAALAVKGAKRVFLQEKALKLLLLHERQRLHEDKEQKSDVAKRRRKLLWKIGYANVTMISNHPKARCCVEGYLHKSCKQGALLSFRLRPGKYKISVRYPLQPPVVRSREVVLLRRSRTNQLFNPPYAPVSIITNMPNTKIVLEGKKLQKKRTWIGALWSLQLPPGDYQVTLFYRHHPPKKKSFLVQEGKHFVLNIPRPPKLPIVRISTQPPGAKVFVNGNFRGSSELQLALKSGIYQLQLKKDCYVPVSKKLQATADKENTLNFPLLRDPKFLQWQQHKKRERMYRVLSWVAISTGIAAIGGSLGLHLYASQKQHEALLENGSETRLDWKRVEEPMRFGNNLRTGAYIALGVGVVSSGLGIVGLLFASPGPKSQIPCQVKFAPSKKAPAK